jgi:hypothetical protein
MDEGPKSVPGRRRDNSAFDSRISELFSFHANRVPRRSMTGCSILNTCDVVVGG